MATAATDNAIDIVNTDVRFEFVNMFIEPELGESPDTSNALDTSNTPNSSDDPPIDSYWGKSGGNRLN